MSSSKVSRELVVTNKDGMNARASCSVCLLARRFNCSIEVVKSPIRANAKDVLQLLSLGACEGTQLILEAEGEQAEAAIAALEKLFADENFGRFAEINRD